MKAKVGIRAAVSVPFLLGVFVGFIISVSSVSSLFVPKLEFVLNAIITCSSTISGFILTSVTVLAGASSSEIMKRIKKHNALPELRWRYTETLFLGLVVIIFFIFLGAIVDESNCVEKLYLTLSAGLLVAYICSVISTCYYLLSIIGLINANSPTVDETPVVPEGSFR